MLYYSKQTNGFYDEVIHGNNIPADAVAITAQQHAELLADQASGKVIVPDANGAPQAVEPKSLLTIEVLKERKKAEVERLRDDKVAGGVPYTFPNGPGTVQTRDEKDMRNIQAQVLAALILAGQPVQLGFRDQEDISHTLTPDQMEAMGLYVSGAINAIYQASWNKKDEIQALETKESVDAYDITTGWPE